MAPEKLVKKCLYNWLGYGKLNSSIWIVGTEESGSGKILQLASALELRSRFNLSMDFCYVWENLYHINLQNGGGIWRYAAYFLLSLQDKNRARKDRQEFISKELGRKSADHFMCELLPLPKKNKYSIEGYAHIWPTVREYHQEVTPKRLSIINENVEKNKKIKLIVSYEHMFTQEMINYHKDSAVNIDEWSYKKQNYCLHKIKLAEDRNVFLLSTPFFGLGQISYDGLDFASQKIKKVVRPAHQ